jgi:hypothetical protein
MIYFHLMSTFILLVLKHEFTKIQGSKNKKNKIQKKKILDKKNVKFTFSIFFLKHAF